jgi:hypothetical protein
MSFQYYLCGSASSPLLHLFLREVVYNVELLPDVLRGRAGNDHVGHRLAPGVEERGDVEVVGGNDDGKQKALVTLKEKL